MKSEFRKRLKAILFHVHHFEVLPEIAEQQICDLIKEKLLTPENIAQAFREEWIMGNNDPGS